MNWKYLQLKKVKEKTIEPVTVWEVTKVGLENGQYHL